MCLEKGGYAIFLTLMGGGHAILSSRNRGGQHFFSYSEALSATSPSAEIYEQSLSKAIMISDIRIQKQNYLFTLHSRPTIHCME